VTIDEDEDDDDDIRTIILYTKPTYFYNKKLFQELTGPDGGFTSTWKCSCSVREVIDK